MKLFMPTRSPSAPRPAGNVRESFGPYGAPYDPIDPRDPGYRNIGLTSRDLFGQDQQRAQNLSLHLYRSNPIAHRAIRLYVAHIAGEGFALEAHNPDVQEVLDEFWTAPRNRMDRHNPWFARDNLIFGEAFHPVATDDFGLGYVTFGFIDPTTVVRVDRSPVNNMILTDIHVQQANSVAEPIPLKIVHRNGVATSANFGQLEGQVFAWPLDRIAAATRGTPLLLPVLDWLDAYDQILWEMLERAKALRAFFWHASVQGDETAMTAAQEAWGNSPPTTGSMRWTTAAVDIEAESPQLGTAEDVSHARYQLRNIATGLGLSPHWLSDPEDANRSTAERMDLPQLTALAAVQADQRLNWKDTGEYVLEQAVMAGRLTPEVEKHDSQGNPTGEMIKTTTAFEVNLPAINDDDIEQAATSLSTVANAFLSLDALGAIGPQTMQLVVRRLLPALGLPADEIPEDDKAALDTFTNREELEELEEAIRSGDTARLEELVTAV